MEESEVEQRKAALGVLRRLREPGFDAFFAGGCVRDTLLDTLPKDYDIATSAVPAEVVRLFGRTKEVGAHFGVVLVIADGFSFEVATFRHDGAYSDGRHPNAVRFSREPREDALRRDFTVNGLLMDPLADPPEILDFVGGKQDLAAKLVRAIGDPGVRFSEDKLRMLRAVRFAARLGFRIESATMQAIQDQSAAIEQVSRERVRDELTRMLTEGRAAQAFALLHESGLLGKVLPEVDRMRGVEQPPQYHPEGDVWVHTLLLLEKLPAGCSATLAWGALLHDVGKPATYQPRDPDKPGDRIKFNGHAEVGVRISAEVLARLRFSNEDAAQIVSLVQQHMRFGDVKNMRESTLKRFLRLPRFEEHLALHHADCSSSHGDLSLYEFARTKYETTERTEVRPQLLITGRELIAAGYKPGPSFKTMLECAEDAQLEGRAKTSFEAMALIERRFGRP